MKEWRFRYNQGSLLAGKFRRVYCLYCTTATLISMEEDTSLVWRKSTLAWRKSKISMQEDIVLVCRKSKISMQEGREVEGKSVIRISSNIHDYSRRAFFIREFTKPRRQRQRERRWTKELMSRTMVLHVRYNCCYISVSSSWKRRREMTKFCVVWRMWTTTAKFLTFYIKFITVFRIYFCDSLDSDKQS